MTNNTKCGKEMKLSKEEKKACSNLVKGEINALYKLNIFKGYYLNILMKLKRKLE